MSDPSTSDRAPAARPPTLAPGARLHFVGIGGAGMSGVASYAIDHGHRVSGSDMRATGLSRALAARGATVAAGHDPTHVHGVDAVVISSAIPEHNVEVREARERGIPVLRRGELLAGFVAEHPGGIAICGTHGKGTTAGALVEMLERAEVPVTYVLGAPRRTTGRRAHHEPGARYFVAEVDESDRTHLHHRPTHLLLNNLEADHLDVYGGLDALVDSFETMISGFRTRDVGHLVLGTDGDGMRDLRRRLSDRAIDPGWSVAVAREADVWARDLSLRPDGGARFELVADGVSHGRFDAALKGELNVRNLVAAAGMALGLGVPIDAIRAASASYGGLVDRFHEFHAAGERLVVTDYTSHPTSMVGNLRSLRARRPNARLIAVFQPYRYSLLGYHWDAYVRALSTADRVILAPFDPCGEQPPPGREISSDALAADLRARRGAGELAVRRTAVPNPFATHCARDLDAVASELVGALEPGDTAIVFGGGRLFDIARRVARHWSPDE